MIPELAPVPADGPFNKQQWNTQQQETNKIRNDKSATAILNCLYREPQKIAQSNSVSRHCKDKSDTGSP
jgi:hypothetical protein